MDLLQRIASIIVPVFFVAAVGWAYGRRTRVDMSTLNRIAVDVLSPFLIYHALAARDFRLADHLPLVMAAVVVILLTGALAWLLARATGTQPRTLVPVVMFGNCGNMGLPLALLAFGPAGFGAAVALFSVSNLLHSALGMRITSTDARTRELLVSPLMLSSGLGFASAITGVRPPELVMDGMNLLGTASVPIMLFTLGARLNSLRAETIGSGLVGALARPLLGMGVALMLAWLLGFEGDQRAQLILFGALPPAVLQFMLAERYRQEPERVAAMVLLGTLLSVFFIPLALAIGL
jgi:predicted permease